MYHIPADIVDSGNLEEELVALDGSTSLVIGWYQHRVDLWPSGIRGRYVYAGDCCLVGERG